MRRILHFYDLPKNEADDGAAENLRQNG